MGCNLCTELDTNNYSNRGGQFKAPMTPRGDPFERPGNENLTFNSSDEDNEEPENEEIPLSKLLLQ